VARADLREWDGTNKFLTAEKIEVNSCRPPTDRKPCMFIRECIAPIKLRERSGAKPFAIRRSEDLVSDLPTRTGAFVEISSSASGSQCE
jgi:hypothetical protein